MRDIGLMIFKRAAQFLILSLLLASATFILSALIPGDFYSAHLLDPTIRSETINELRQQHGLDLPVHMQYLRWLKNCARFDFGFSLFYQRPVTGVIADGLEKTLWLGIPALILGLGGGVILGTVHALCRNRFAGRILDLLSTVGLSLPSLLIGSAALLFALRTGWFPLGGIDTAGLQAQDFWHVLIDRMHHLVLPVCCLAIPLIAAVERIQFSAAADCVEQLHVRAALARGLGSGRIFFQHILRPSLNPVLSISGPLIGAVLSGSLVLEIIFSWPGLGQIAYDALFNSDLQLLVGCVLGSSLVLAGGIFLADLAMAVLDPRTRATQQGAHEK